MIRIQNLRKTYGDTVCFEQASFSFPEKGLVCILGPSGCGKSTLLNLLAGFDCEYEGEISVCGISLSGMNAEELCAYRRDHIGFVFQNYHLLSGYTVLENVTLASDVTGETRENGEAEAKDLLYKLGLSEKTQQKIETLSGGQKQRTAIARALMHNPSVILADEPTGALDRKTSSEIMELLKKLAESRLVLMITHDKKCAEYADEIVEIQDGKLICEHPILDNSENTGLVTKKAPKISLWKRAFKNFQVHLPRYIAIAFAISMGVLCFMLSLSSGNIMEQSIRDFEEKNTAYHNGYIKTDGNEKEILDLLEADERIENSYAQYVLSGVSVKIGEETVDVEEKYPMAKAIEKMSYGVMPRRGEKEIALNPSMAAKFDKNIQDLIGKTAELTLNGQTYSLTVSGIFNAMYDDYYVSSDMEQKMYEGIGGNVYSVSYDVAAFEEIPKVSESLREQKIESKNASAEVGTFLDTFKNLKRLFFTVSALIFGIGVFISTILLVKQQNTRSREVGLLLALGYTKNQVRKILLYENVGLAAVSVLSGVLLQLLAAAGSRIAGFSFVFTMLQIVLALMLTAVLMLLIGYAASFRLMNTEPAKALR